MSKYFAGIRPVQAGYGTFLIKPQLTAPDTVRCVVPSVKGCIRVTESKTDDAFVLDADVPKDTTACIYMPYSDGQTIKLNGSLLYSNGRFAGAEGVAFMHVENGYAVFSAKASEDLHLHFEAIQANREVSG